MQQHYIRRGLVEKLSNKKSSNVSYGFHLERWLKKVLNFLHITSYDPCCDNGDVRPLRVLIGEGNQIQYFDGEDWVALDITTFSTGFSGDITTDDGVYTVVNGVITEFTAAP